MVILADRRVLIAGAAAGAMLLAWIATAGIRGAAKSTGRAVVGMAEGTVTGVVLGIGDAVGVPETNQDQCAADLAAGRTWDSSFSCPAGTFIKSLF